MVQIRGGVDKLKMDQFMNAGIQVAMNDPGIFTSHIGGTSSDSGSGQTPLRYPELPLSPELQAVLSTMPKGCAELAVQGSAVSPFSHEILHIILALSTWISLAQKLPKTRTRILCGKFIQMVLQQSTQPIEAMMCMAILLYSIRAIQDDPSRVRLDMMILEQIRAFRNQLENESGRIYKELQFWVVLMATDMGQTADVEICRAANELLDDILRDKNWTSD